MCTFTVMCYWIFLRMRNILGKFVVAIKTRILCTITFPPHPENNAVYEIMW